MTLTTMICMQCGRPKPREGQFRYRHTPHRWCTDRSHVGWMAITDEALKELAQASRDYHTATDIDARAAAMSDWLSVLQGSHRADQGDQLDLIGGQS